MRRVNHKVRYPTAGRVKGGLARKSNIQTIFLFKTVLVTLINLYSQTPPLRLKIKGCPNSYPRSDQSLLPQNMGCFAVTS